MSLNKATVGGINIYIYTHVYINWIIIWYFQNTRWFTVFIYPVDVVNTFKYTSIDSVSLIYHHSCCFCLCKRNHQPPSSDSTDLCFSFELIQSLALFILGALQQDQGANDEEKKNETSETRTVPKLKRIPSTSRLDGLSPRILGFWPSGLENFVFRVTVGARFQGLNRTVKLLDSSMGNASQLWAKCALMHEKLRKVDWRLRIPFGRDLQICWFNKIGHVFLFSIKLLRKRLHFYSTHLYTDVRIVQ